MFTSFHYSSEVDVRNWYRRVLREGEYTVSAARIALLETLVGGLKTDGVWSKLDRLWLLAAELQTAALVDLVGGALATAGGSPSFTVDRGYSGQDSSIPTNYIDSNFTPSVNGVTFTQNSAHFSGWCVTQNADVSGGSWVGSNGVLSQSWLQVIPSATVFNNINNNPYNSGVGTAPSNIVGLWISNRSGASAAQMYFNGASFGTDSTDGSYTMDNKSYGILCQRVSSNIPRLGTASRLGAISLGGSLNATNALNFYTRLRTFMTAIGVP